MKLIKELYQTRLEEGKLKTGVATVATAAALLMHGGKMHQQQNTVHKLVQQQKAALENLKQVVIDSYDVAPSLVDKIMKSVSRHSKPDFPKAEDLLAVIGVESEFNPRAKSKLASDPALGLMQIRPGVNDLDAVKIGSDIDYQIKVGAQMLADYYRQLGSEKAALEAYNVGITSYKTGKRKNPRYSAKVMREKQKYE